MRTDKFYNLQPEKKYISLLDSPMHESAPQAFARRIPEMGEVSAVGAYIKECEEHWHDTLYTATSDFEAFLRSSMSHGDRYPIRIVCTEGFGREDFKISTNEKECVIYSSDSEGARRGIYYLEEEMIKREGAFLPLGDTVRCAVIKRRITRGFFSPTNRPPKFGDELLDDIDYYPENYLSKLAHNGTNGLWIYTSFAQLVSSPYIPSMDENCNRRMKKLADVVAKCKKYGIKVYLFAIEPMSLFGDDAKGKEDMLGSDAISGFHPLCPRSEKTRAHIIFCLKTIFSSIPDLGGYITIPAGERVTTCVSVGNYKTCPRCGKYSRGENLAYSVDVIKEGLRQAGTGAEFISWTYGHRYWPGDEIAEYIEKAPDDIAIMQNFEDGGVDIQLGKERVAWDYWLSYTGPCEMFSNSARAAKKHGNPMYAKLQVCSSHEIATVPYIPVPGILFDKYKAARELGVSGVMECWYFGNYPSLMNRASTELSYLEDFSNKNAFLLELASRIYGRSKAERTVAAWQEFEKSYKNYPTNIMFSYYGPMHDGVVWDLFPIPVNRALPRSWQLIDPPDGDRIGECLFKGHTLDEALVLSEGLVDYWKKGLSLLPALENDEQMTCAEAISVLFQSGRNILKFYKLREELGTRTAPPYAAISEMEKIVRDEIANSERMIELCHNDPRIGYHSESEGFKFFPEKLKYRIENLKKLFDGDFSEIKKRVSEGKAPLGCYLAEGEEFYPLGKSKDNFVWEKIDNVRAFGAYVECEEIKIPIKCFADDTFSLCFEFALFCPESRINYSPKATASSHLELAEQTAPGLSLGPCVLSHQSVFGEGIEKELANYKVESKFENGMAEHLFSAKIPKDKWNGKNAIHLDIKINDIPWKSDPEPIITLGKADISPNSFGTLLPIEEGL